MINCISSYCDTEEKEKVLIENINFFKKYGIESAVISPIPVSKKIQDLVKYTFITHYNPVFDWPVHAFSFWKSFKHNNKDVVFTTTKPDYGWTTISHIKTMGDMLSIQGEKDIIYTIYDAKVTDEHISKIKENKGNLLFPSKRGNDIWEIGTHLMYFNNEYFNIFNEQIDLNEYLSDNLGAMGYLKKKLNKSVFNLINLPVEDKIYYFDNDDLFSYNTKNNIKYFVSSKDNEVVIFYIYDFNLYNNLKLEINDNFIDMSDNIINTNYIREEINNIKIYYNDLVCDITEDFKKIKHNQIIIK